MFCVFVLCHNLTLESFQLLIGNFLIKLFFGPYEHFFMKLKSSLKVSKAKENFSDNSNENILQLHNVLVQARLVTGKMKLDK